MEVRISFLNDEMRLIAGIFAFIASAYGAYAQDVSPDTVLSLNDVTIYSDRISRFAKGQAVMTLDSMTRMQYPAGNMSDLLGGFTTAYIRNYGQGTLTTLSIRGSSANHAGMLWNGIRLSPPNIGYVDLSLIQGNFFEDISILFGGASPMFGSGSIGGGLHLNNRPIFQERLASFSTGFSAGSFNTFSFEGKAQGGNEKVFSHTAVSVMGTRNDFSYMDSQENDVKLPHANVFKAGMIQDFAVNLPGKQYIMGSLWFQAAEREIPPTLTESTSEAVQSDRTWRSMLIWRDFNHRNTMEAKLAYFNEFTLYDDPLTKVYSNIHSQMATAAYESTWDLTSRSAIFAGSQYTYEYAALDFYEKPESQQNLAIFASYRQNFPTLKWQVSLNARYEFLTSYQGPFLFSVGMEGKIWKIISGKVNISRNFRAPTLNERFWQPGGNPVLEPEESWNAEAGFLVAEDTRTGKLSGRITGFFSMVDNWILWLPGSSFWSVENAQEVWSRGVEVAGDQAFLAGHFKFYLTESYTFSRSTNEKKLFDLDASYHKQLIYTPIHRLLLKAGVGFKGFSLMLQGSFTGEVYSAKDNSTSLPSYFLLDSFISKAFKLKKKNNFSLQLNLNNILDKNYQVVPYRPMPGFNFLVTMKVDLSQRSAVSGQQSAVSDP